MEKLYGWGLPFNASTHGASIDNVIIFIHYFMAALFIGWLAFLVYSLIKFRARPGHFATYKQKHFKAPTYIEVMIVLTEIVLLACFSIPIYKQVQRSLPNPDDAIQVRVVAEQFAWNIHYPGPDNKFGRSLPTLMSASNPVGLDDTDPNSDDDIVSVNQFKVPVNKPVIVHLTSKDVIHSFGIPVMRVKQDVIPGQEISISFEANKTGDFEIACAQLCGLGHYRMRGFFQVEEPAEFDTWLQQKVDRKLKKIAQARAKALAKKAAAEKALLDAAEELKAKAEAAITDVNEKASTLVNTVKAMASETEIKKESLDALASPSKIMPTDHSGTGEHHS